MIKLLSIITEINLITKLKHIIVSERDYYTLKSLGEAGDSFNDVVNEMSKRLQQAQSFPTLGHVAVAPNGGDPIG